MGAVSDAFASAFRDFVAAGVPASGQNEPAKAELRGLGRIIEQFFAASGIGNTIYETTAAGIAATTDGQLFLVAGDGSPNFAELYKNEAGVAVDQNVALPSAAYADTLKGQTSDYIAAQTGARNIFDASAVTPNTGLNGAIGLTFVAPGFSVSPYMAVHPGSNVVVNIDLMGYSFYGFDRSFIGGAQSSTSDPLIEAGEALAVPSNAFYMRIGTLSSAILTLVVTEGDALPAGYMPFDSSQETERVFADGVSYQHRSGPEPRNRFDSTRARANYSINGATGEEYAAGGFSVAPFIPVEPGMPVVCNIDLSNLAWYSRSGQFLTGVQSSGTPVLDAGDPVTPPTSAYYLKFGFPSSIINTIAVFAASSLPEFFYPFDGQPFMPWKGRKIAFVGDSISAVDLYQPVVAAHLQADLVGFTDDSVAGRKIAAAIPVLTEENLEDLALLCFFLGTNDFGGDTPLGAYGDAASEPTFYGQARGLLETALTANPNLTLAVITPMKRLAVAGDPPWDEPNEVGHVLGDYVDALIRVAGDLGVAVLDFFRTSGLNDLTIPTKTSDGLHPTVAELQGPLAQKIAAFLAAT